MQVVQMAKRVGMDAMGRRDVYVQQLPCGSVLQNEVLPTQTSGFPQYPDLQYPTIPRRDRAGGRAAMAEPDDWGERGIRDRARAEGRPGGWRVATPSPPPHGLSSR